MRTILVLLIGILIGIGGIGYYLTQASINKTDPHWLKDAKHKAAELYQHVSKTVEKQRK
jgi:hypothetical protein